MFAVFGLWNCTTNKKEQMPPQRLITLTHGIQIRRQPIKKNIKKLKMFLKKFHFFFLYSATFFWIFAHGNMKKPSSKVAHNSYLAENWFPILEIRLRHPLFFLLCELHCHRKKSLKSNAFMIQINRFWNVLFIQNWLKLESVPVYYDRYQLIIGATHLLNSLNHRVFKRGQNFL